MSRNNFPRPPWLTGKIIAISLIGLAIVIAVGWFILGYWADVTHVMWRAVYNSVIRGWLFPNGVNVFGATPFFWLLAVGALFGVISYRRRNKVNNRGFFTVAIATGTVWILFAGYSIFMWGDWNGRVYNSGTTYAMSDTENMPNSLSRIGSSSRAQVDFAEGKMPDNWEHRRASATGATYVMQKTGDTIQNSVLMSETLTYIYDDTGGSWTGIRNGINRQPIYGVASWSGAGESVKTCQFKGENSLNKAFGGSWGMNLNDEIAAFDSSFLYDAQDIYGYCDGDKPVIVIPGVKIIGNVVQTAIESYGVLVITGSPTGQPVMDFRDSIEPGELPGPAYPVKLVEEQRNALSWSAGRVWWWQPPVGFESATSASQAGNNTDFLLKSKEDGRLYWVTPLKPRNSQSETITAYALVAADEMKAGQLNPQMVYVLDDNDPNIVNFNDLENAVTQAVAVKDPGFFTGGEENVGQIVEFIPTGTGSWRVFAERGGRAVYEIHVSGGSLLHTTVSQLADDGKVTEPVDDSNIAETSGEGCNDPASLSDAEIAACINDLSGELVNRGGSEG